MKTGPPAAAAHAVPAALLLVALTAAAGDEAFYAAAFDKPPSVAAMTELGRALFSDTSLSASGRIACSTCHDPARAYGPPNAQAVQRGGRDGRQSGLRAVPSLRYLQNAPPFTEHWTDDDGDDGADQGPAGGRNWDGRSPSAHEQARQPLFSPFEMANASAALIALKLRRGSHAAQFRAVFGEHILDDPGRAIDALLLALEAFQQDPRRFYPYSSKYDAWLRHETSLSRRELRGLAVFNDPAKGNCARCHPSAIKAGAFPQFTDFGYAALGVPRNRAIPANADPGFHDLGVCGPLRSDLAGRGEYCGLFRTPSLRNVATRRVFFHNGVFHRLQDVLRFYASRDSSPWRWYPRTADGRAREFDDLPPEYAGNVERAVPFDRRPGDPPAFSERDSADLIAFLKTLSDGYSPAKITSRVGRSRLSDGRATANQILE